MRTDEHRQENFNPPQKCRSVFLTSDGVLLPSIREPFGEAFRKSGGADFCLRSFDIVIEAAEFDRAGVHVVEDVGALGIIIARLADGTDVDEIFFGRINFKFRVSAAAHDGVAHERNRNVRVAEETHLRVLIRETGGGGELVEDVTPAVGRIECGVNHRKVRGHAGVFQIAQPLFVVGGKLVARPVDGFGGVRIETVEGVFSGAVFVVIAFNDGDIHVAYDLQTFLGIGVVADDVAEADDVRRILGANILQHYLKRFPVAVNVCDDGVFHFLASYLKSLKFIFRVRPNYLFVPNKSSQTCIVQRGAESVKFRVGTFRDKLDPTIRQIFYRAGDFKTGGDSFGSITKADTLHATGEKNQHPAARGGLSRRQHGGMKPKCRARCNVFWRRRAKIFLFGLTDSRLWRNHFVLPHIKFAPEIFCSGRLYNPC